MRDRRRRRWRQQLCDFRECRHLRDRHDGQSERDDHAADAVHAAARADRSDRAARAAGACGRDRARCLHNRDKDGHRPRAQAQVTEQKWTTRLVPARSSSRPRAMTSPPASPAQASPMPPGPPFRPARTGGQLVPTRNLRRLRPGRYTFTLRTRHGRPRIVTRARSRSPNNPRGWPGQMGALLTVRTIAFVFLPALNGRALIGDDARGAGPNPADAGTTIASLHARRHHNVEMRPFGDLRDQPTGGLTCFGSAARTRHSCGRRAAPSRLLAARSLLGPCDSAIGAKRS